MSPDFRESINNRLREQLLTEAAEQRGLFIENAWSIIHPFAQSDAEVLEVLNEDTGSESEGGMERAFSLYVFEDYLALPEEKDVAGTRFQRALGLHFVRNAADPEGSDTLTIYMPISDDQALEHIGDVLRMKKPEVVYVERRAPKSNDPLFNDEPARLAISYDGLSVYTTASDGVETVTEFEAFEEVMAGLDSGKTNTGLMLLGKLNEDLLNMSVIPHVSFTLTRPA
jgi:hypothetical protein